MLSASPDHTSAASPPGAPSSQSSSVGSCYTSSSSQASVRARHTLSDPSSSSTSPASAFDRSSDYHTAPAPAKRPSNGAASAAHTNHSFSALAAQQTGLAPSAASATMNPHSTAYEAMDPRAYLRAGPSSRAHPDAATPSPNEPRYPQSGSPDNSRAPAAKTRRTSPGGSRASGNLAPSHYDGTESPHPEYSAIAHAPRSSQPDMSANSSAFTSSNASTLHPSSSFAPMDWSSEASAHASSHRAAGPGDPRSVTSHMPTSNATMASTSSSAASPRTYSDGQSHPAHQHAPLSSGAQAPASISSRASASSSADRAETKSHAQPMPKMDLATFPPQELLKILATLLQEIASANDDFQPDGSKDESRSRRGARTRDRSTPATPAEASDSADTAAARDYAAPPGSHLSFSDSRRPSVTTAALGALATPSSTLCFHARNVPSISIESYLLRILKYCPTTNEVFLSLLVYFDRMSRMGTGAKPGANGGGEAAGEAAGLPRALERATGQADAASQPFATRSSDGEASSLDSKPEHAAALPGIRGFAIDSYNVHRLVIAGVTVASKFFSDVFYTNSRYAKVGGLPPHELNQLELQFLLLNDFRLTIPLEEMQRYADQLLMYGSGRAELARSTKQANPAGSLGASRPSAAAGEPVAGRPSTSAAENVEHDSAGATLQTAPQARPTDEAGVDPQGDVHMSDVKTS